MPELYVLDADYKAAGEAYDAKAREVEALAEAYITTLQAIADDGILAGDTGAALLAFSSLAKSYLSLELSGISNRHQGKTAAFTDMAQADDEADIR